MLIDEAAIRGPQRHAAHLAQWENGRTPEDGEPDAVVEVVVWMEGEQEITDPQRLAELEARFRAKYGEEAN